MGAAARAEPARRVAGRSRAAEAKPAQAARLLEPAEPWAAVEAVGSLDAEMVAQAGPERGGQERMAAPWDTCTAPAVLVWVDAAPGRAGAARKRKAVTLGARAPRRRWEEHRAAPEAAGPWVAAMTMTCPEAEEWGAVPR